MSYTFQTDPITPALIARAQLGDRAAMEQLLHATQPWLRRCLFGLLGEPEADDALQDVLLIVARRLPLIDEPRAYRSWVYRVATRHALRLIKRRRHHAPLDDSLPSPTAAAPPDAEELERLREQIAQLSPNSRIVIVLHYNEQLTIAQVADVLDLPEGTVKSRLAAALSTLRRALNKETPS